MSDPRSSPEKVLAAVEGWLREFVIAHQLCPFAAQALDAQRTRFALTQTTEPAVLLQALSDELALLVEDPTIATTLLVHPRVLNDFMAYNDFLDKADALLRETGLEGVFQIASFHPHYRFADAGEDDPANFSNRSPYPLLHVLREEDVSRAVDAHPNIHGLPERNIRCLRAIGTEELQRALGRWNPA